MTTLLLITAAFPYGQGETFLENEIPVLAKHFQEIILMPINPSSEEIRLLPANVMVSTKKQIAPNKFGGNLRQLFSPIFWTELNIVSKKYGVKISLLAVKQLLSSLYVAKKITKILSPQAQRDTIFYSYWADESALALALLKRKNPTLRAITRAHGWDVYFERRNTGFIPYRQLLFQHIDAVFFIAEQGCQYTIQRFPEYQQKFNVSYLGTLQGQQITKTNQSTPFRIVSASNLIDLKRVDLLIKALSMLQTPVEWVHFGDGPNEPPLKALAATLFQGKTNISWQFRGRVSNQTVLAYYKQQQPHLFINVSTTEGLPVSIMEAMTHSIPVVATDVGGTKEIVQHNVNGLLLSANITAEELAAQITAIIEMNDAVYQAMRTAAYETWLNKFNAKINYQHFAEQLLRL